jgi:hypothetical protein
MFFSLREANSVVPIPEASVSTAGMASIQWLSALGSLAVSSTWLASCSVDGNTSVPVFYQTGRASWISPPISTGGRPTH